MDFTEKDLENIEQIYIGIKARISEIQKDPERLLSLAHDESPYIWRRLEALAAMTPDELQEEIEADYVLFMKPFNKTVDFKEISWEEAQPGLEIIAKKYKDYS